MSAATVDQALVALVMMWDAGTPEALQVRDGGPIIDARRDWLAVGYGGGETPAVQVVLGTSDAGLRQDIVSYDIACLLGTWDGNKTLTASRAEALAYFDTLRTLLKANNKLGVPGVTRAMITQFDLDQDVSTLGMAVQVPFTVHVDAFSVWPSPPDHQEP